MDFSSLEKLNESIWNKMNGFFEGVDPLKFKGLKENSTETEQKAVCRAFANYIWIKSR